MKENMEIMDCDDSEKRIMARKSFSGAGLMTVSILVVAYVLVYFIYSLPLGAVRETEAFLWLSNYIVLFCIAMPLSFLWVRKLPRRILEKKELKVSNLLRYYCMAEFTVFSANFISQDFLSMVSNAWSIDISRPIAEMVSSTSIGWQLVIAVLIGPICEELCFRKIMIDRLSVFGERQAVIFSALTFALYHGNAEQYLYAFAMGLVFAYIYIRKGNLLYTILLHMAVNFSGSIIPRTIMSLVDLEKLQSMDMTGMNNEEVIQMLTSQGYGIYLLYVAAVLLIGGFGGAFLVRGFRRRNWKEAPLELPKGMSFEACYCNIGMLVLTAVSLGIAVYSILSNAG